jgi:Peptidase C13 family
MTTINHNHLKLIYYQLFLLTLLLGFLPPAQAWYPYMTTVAGNGQEGYDGDGGRATAAQLKFPMGIAIDQNGDIYFAEMNGPTIGKIDTQGILTTIAGIANHSGYGGDGGPAIQAYLDSPNSLAIDRVRRQLYVADSVNHRIRQIDLTTGIITTLAGAGKYGYEGDGGPAKDAWFKLPMGVAVAEKTGDVYIADTFNGRIRRVDMNTPDKIITTIAGKDFYADEYPKDFGDGRQAVDAYLEGPMGVMIGPDDNIYVADSNNSRVRRIDVNGIIETLGVLTSDVDSGWERYVCNPGIPSHTNIAVPTGVVLDNQMNIYVSDLFNHVVCYINLQTSEITMVAGTGDSGYGEDFQPASSVDLNYPSYLAIDNNQGVLYVSEGKNNKIRKIGGLLVSDDNLLPVITITSPQVTSSALEGTLTLSGTATDAGVGIGDVGIQVKIVTPEGKTLYLAEVNRFTDTREWLYPTGKENWSYDLSKVNFPAGTCTVTARAFDRAGNFSDAKVEGLACSPPAHTVLTLSVSSPTILQKPNELFEVYGKLIRLPDTGVNLSGQPLTVELKNLETGTSKTCAVTTDDLANYTVTLPNPGCPTFDFDAPGKYSVQATFAGSTMLEKSASPTQEVLVGQSAGYAVLVQGSLPPNNEGMEAYNKTLNRIYRTLRFDRGLRDEDILYFNYTPTQVDKDLKVDGVPSKVAVKTALESLATSLNEVPAPVYFILVDHGNSEKLFVGNDVITPADLNEWLTTLEGRLTNPFFAQHPFQEIIILGACYSGSFIPPLSKGNRVIITSAAANEVSYKGLKESDAQWGIFYRGTVLWARNRRYGGRCVCLCHSEDRNLHP